MSMIAQIGLQTSPLKVDTSRIEQRYLKLDPTCSASTCAATDMEYRDSTSSVSTTAFSLAGSEYTMLGPCLSAGSRGTSLDSYQGDILGLEFSEQDQLASSLQQTRMLTVRGISLDSIDEDLLADVVTGACDPKKPLSPVVESPDSCRPLPLVTESPNSSNPSSPDSNSLLHTVLLAPPGLELTSQQPAFESTASIHLASSGPSALEGSADPCEATKLLMGEKAACVDSTVNIALMPAVLPSVGSASHGSGRCQPCNWFWKPQGCVNGAACRHCHICPPGEVKARQKLRHGYTKPLPAPRVAYEKVAEGRIDGAATIASEFGRIPDVWRGQAPPFVCDLPSRGSVLHMAGRCKPCGWFWKPSGCQNGAECGYCHLCPEEAVKERKKQKHRTMFTATLKREQSLEPVRVPNYGSDS